ncbi:PREDICTED: uncharacterized protein LOC109219657 [Nicotiana attenuata]|uniref:uncharacterized protein LOC109219657 n=1 Tax=Nicotiana attenuata TaxID=49451 RepID=UPI0009054F15|nr:PREDICTED: uncharacterized protein LOC109219657 [Nicotiana attenuata]
MRRDHPVSRPNRERQQPYVWTPTPFFRNEDSPSRPRSGIHRNNRGMPPLLSAHNFSVSPTEVVYGLEKFGTKVKWLPKLRSDPNTRKFDALYEFHEECGEKKKDCIALRLEVVNLLQRGHLKEMLSDKGRNTLAMGRERQGLPKPHSLACTINMIISGCEDATINGIKFTATHKLKRLITHEQYDRLEERIIFDESDADGLTFPHNDALVITLRILDTHVKRNLVDDRSGVCIIHPRVLAQMILEDKIVLRCIPLTSFNNAVEQTSGEITLPVLGSRVTLEIMFHIMDHATA